jgi:hypothetical protein
MFTLASHTFAQKNNSFKKNYLNIPIWLTIAILHHNDQDEAPSAKRCLEFSP